MNYPLMTKGETKEDKENMKLILWFEFKERENIAQLICNITSIISKPEMVFTKCET